MGVFLHWPFSDCVVVFCVLATSVTIMTLALGLLRRRKQEEAAVAQRPWTKEEKVLAAVVMVLALWQILFVLIGKNSYRRGDMTVETIRSFLQTNGIYQVNPLTGGTYEGGIPSRLKILCLPTMYAAMCRVFHMNPQMLAWQVIPVLTLGCCYSAYFSLAKSLFPGDRRKALWFLVAVALLVWVGSYAYGMEGFGLLYAGWRGVTLRNAVLIPWAFSLCLRKKYLWALLCVAAEACIVWTLYGLGACLPVIIGMAVIRFCLERVRAGKETAK